MQELYSSKTMPSQNLVYSSDMAKLLKRTRPPMGTYLATLRKEAGLSQYELAKLLDVPQSNIAFWELSDKPPRSDVLPKLAKILGVKVDAILNPQASKKGKSGGPVGKAQKIFEQVSMLPKNQQNKIIEVVAAFVQQQGLAGR